jgi:hypothetical protein
MTVTVDQTTDSMDSIDPGAPPGPPNAVGHESPRGLSRTRWLSRPLSFWWCAFGWLTATAVFVGLTQLLGGPAQGDADESLYSTWAIAHGHLSCSYPVRVAVGLPLREPLYPLLSGAFAALARIGHSVPFPSLGYNCASAVVAMNKWAARSGVNSSSVLLGYLSWFVLAAGLVALLRASGRGRCGWEPVTLLLVAIAPPVLMCVRPYFHPEDLLAMGLGLGGLACARRGSWVLAGVLLGLSFTSQQFVLLLIAPLVVVAPSNRRLRFAGSAIISVMLVVGPMILLTSGQVIASVTGRGSTPQAGQTVLAQLPLHGPALFVVSRIFPIALSVALAQWMARRLGPAILESLPLASLVAVSLSLRLVFEVNLFGYYFMAITLMLIVLDVIRGRISSYLIAWLVLICLAFDPLPWGYVPFSTASQMAWQLLVVPAALLLAVAPLISAAYPQFGAQSRIGSVLRTRVNLGAIHLRPRTRTSQKIISH